MNKSAFFIVLLVTIALSSCSKIASFDGILSKLVQLNTAAGKDSNHIASLIASVKNSYQDAENQFGNFIKAVEGKCAAGETAHKSFVERLDAEVTSLEASSQAATDNISAVQKLIEENNNSLKKATSNLEDTKNQISHAVEEYNTYSVEAEAKLVVIKTLRDIINDELYNHNIPKTSFVQLKTFTSKVRELQSLLNNKNDILISPLVSTLLSLAQNNKFSDQGILQKILEVLGSLENSLKKFRSDQESTGRESIKSLKDLARTAVNEIIKLNEIDQSLKSQLSDSNATVTRAKQEIQEISNEKKRKVNEFTYFGKICDYQQSIKTNSQGFNQRFSEEATKIENQITNLQ